MCASWQTDRYTDPEIWVSVPVLMTPALPQYFADYSMKRGGDIAAATSRETCMISAKTGTLLGYLQFTVLDEDASARREDALSAEIVHIGV